MNTTFSIIVNCEDKLVRRVETLLLSCHEEIHKLETELSEFLPSPIFALNHSEPLTPIPMPQSFWGIWRYSQEVSRVSENGFDIFAKGSGREFQVDETQGTLMRLNRDTHIGLGAIGKGYALDKISEILVREGFTNYCLNAGGSSQILSGMNEDKPWEFAWSWEEGKGIHFTHQQQIRYALGISGTMTQKQHLIDPRTQKPTSPVVVSLIGHPSAAMADALSTALYVNGFDRSLAHFGELLEKPAIAVIESDLKPRWNGIFQNWWGGLCSLFLCSTLRADESIDLSDVTDFNPYLTEKNFIWILLPLVTLFWVFLHLKQPPHTKEQQ